MQKNSNQAKMTESEGIQAVVNQAAIQAVTAVMLVPRDTDVRPWLATAASLRESWR